MRAVRVASNEHQRPMEKNSLVGGESVRASKSYQRRRTTRRQPESVVQPDEGQCARHNAQLPNQPYSVSGGYIGAVEEMGEQRRRAKGMSRGVVASMLERHERRVCRVRTARRLSTSAKRGSTARAKVKRHTGSYVAAKQPHSCARSVVCRVASVLSVLGAEYNHNDVITHSHARQNAWPSAGHSRSAWWAVGRQHRAADSHVARRQPPRQPNQQMPTRKTDLHAQRQTSRSHSPPQQARTMVSRRQAEMWVCEGMKQGR